MTKNKKLKFTNDFDKEDIEINYMLNNLTSDGGQWNIFYGLVKKYGLIPKTTMDDHYHSKNTRQFKIFYNNFLRKASQEIINSNEKKEIILKKYLMSVIKFWYYF